LLVIFIIETQIHVESYRDKFTWSVSLVKLCYVIIVCTEVVPT